MAKDQIDPKENVDLINKQLHTTFYFWRFFASKVNLILKVWLNVSNQYIRESTLV